MNSLIVELDGGLDDTAKKPTVQPGTLKSCLNYERGIIEGYTRIDGFSRWDGRFNFTQATSALSFASEVTGSGSAYVVGTSYTILTSDGEYSGTCLCITTSTDAQGGGAFIYSGTFCLIEPGIADLATIISIGVHSTSTISSPSYVSTTTLDSAYRSLVTGLPMSTAGKIAGAHFFRNRLYVVADLVAFTVSGLLTLNFKEGAEVRNHSLSTNIGYLVGYYGVGGSVTAGTGTATLMVRTYSGHVPTAGHDIYVQGNAGRVGDFVAFVQANRAGLYYAAYNGAGGWTAVDAGRRMRYKTDASASGASFLGYTRDGFSGAVVATTTPTPLTIAPYEIRAGEFSAWTSSSAPADPPLAADLAASGGNAILRALGTGSGYSTGTITIRFGVNVAAQLPAGATVVGVKVTIRRANSAAVGTIRDQDVTLVGLTGPTPVNKADLVTTWPLNLAYVEKTYGDVLDTWGSTLKTEDVRSADFGVRIAAQQFPATDICIAYIDQVSVEISYREQTEQIYVRRGASDITNFKVIHYTIDNGKTFTANPVSANLAEGTIVVTDLTSVYARGADLQVGDQLRTASGGGGSLIAYVNSVDEPITLPSSDILATAGTRWTFTTCDPWAVDDSDVMVMCSGVEEAYGFDGTYLLPIATGLKPASEIPRHAAYFQNQLYLGYGVGIVIPSDVGEIFQFAGGEAGAVECGVSDRVVGLLALRGQALAVFTERGIRAIYSDGGGNIEPKVISDSSGAIEYTVVDMGVPVFADFRGLATLSAVQEYGDFQRGRLTNRVTRLMLSRLQFETRNQTVDKRPVAAVAIRNRNQYRLYYKDGYSTTLTLAGDAIDPQATEQRYFISGANTDANACRVLALATGVTSEGRDVAFFTIDNQSAMWKYAYQIDAGRSFDTGAIVASLTLNPIWGGQASTPDKWDRMNVFGLAYGSASLTYCFAKALTTPSTANARAFVLGAVANTPGVDPEDYSVSLPDMGLSDAPGIAIRFDSSTATELPHTLQVLDITTTATAAKKR